MKPNGKMVSTARQDLLGHCAVRITTRYAAAELSELIEAANSVCARPGAGKPERDVLRRLAMS
jgi:hypothetical protein